MFKFENGMKAKDRITGLEGTIVSRAEYLNGCISYGIRPPLKDGVIIDCEWIDEGQIEIIGEKDVSIGFISGSRTGGPQRENPPSTSN